MTASPIDWETVQDGLRAWVRAATELPDGRVIWAYPDNPEPMRPFAWVSIIAGPRALTRLESRRTSQIMRDRIRVATAAVQTYSVTIFEADGADEEGVEYSYVAQVGDDAEAIRDGLVAELADSDLTIADDPDDDAALLIDGTSERPHFHTVVSPSPALARTTVREAILETAYFPSELTVRVQVETNSQLPDGHARAYLSRCENGLGLRSIRQLRQTAGLAFHRAFAMQDLTALIGSKHVSRMAQDFHFGVASHADENVPWVRTATATGSLC